MKKIISIIASMFFAVTVFAQGITTANTYFKSVSEFYATLKTYEANFEISMGQNEMGGHLSFKTPDLLRLDFSNPEEQVIVFNSDTLTIYLPRNDAVLQQQISSDSSGASLATPQGLNLMNRYYNISYENGQNAEPLEEFSDEMVIKLLLNRKNTSEAFRYIKLAISENTKLIRRVEAVTSAGDTIIFDFLDYVINRDIADERFLYDAPATANNYNNFLFTD